MAQTKLIYPSLDKSLNNKELIFRGWDAVQATIYSLLTTPINMLPEMPTMGFDLEDFLFRAHDDPEIEHLANELGNKLRVACVNESINSTVFVDGKVVFIKITWEGDGKKYSLPITIEEGTGGRVIKFKNITLR